MPKSRSRAKFSWKQEYGGVPAWGIAAGIGLLAVILAVPAVVNATTPAAAPYVRPSDAFAETPATDDNTLTMPAPGEPVYIIGDSWTNGYGASTRYVDALASSTGWVITANAQNGTGYVTAAAGQPFIARLAELPTEPPALLIIQGGLNDEQADPGALASAAGELIATARTRYPDAQIALVGPAPIQLPASSGNTARADNALRQAASEAGVTYVSPLIEGWVTADNIGAFIDPATLHPSDAGQAEYAALLEAALTQ